MVTTVDKQDFPEEIRSKAVAVVKFTYIALNVKIAFISFLAQLFKFLQSNLDYPDFSIIRTFSMVPFFS